MGQSIDYNKCMILIRLDVSRMTVSRKNDSVLPVIPPYICVSKGIRPQLIFNTFII